ncbi:hypothetical protein BABINDRAFT_11763 [Babjeviella inositovora NRRL Y-12698]|uniref:Sphingolipid delta(4)-desaturase n=1 Tax=Babjeviella inositovora NRRL Y-12698 TaxID=984486 RepID=A0A1E3QVG2_9ASCO|nr:uncharacterized protein BABINDRAFT_11763 [Babjeviella inositovora NRRL Y-12698]ODQ81648.1 hypothetical protein BABINDRAFT_11763 [Babjeviella inositovora NRRL Y-12698]
MTTITHRKSRIAVDTTTPDASPENLAQLKDFYWTRESEPHVLRRKQILAKYPQVTKLCGHEPLTKYIATGVVLLQFLSAYVLRDTHPLSWKFVAWAYVVGATANQNVFLAIHELSHNLGFKKPMHNRLFSIFNNLPIGIPYAASFQPYHQLHHKFMGDDALDTDLPTRFEAVVLSNVLGKAFFATFQILFYAFRPMCVTQIKFTAVHLLNVMVQLAVDFLVVRHWGWYAMFYFLMSSFLAGSLHPTAGHFIAEHYVLNPSYPATKNADPSTRTLAANLQPETFSYYGPLNFFTWNVGLHNEHHDFPFVPWTRLHTLRDIAREFYEPLPQIDSWVMVIVSFVSGRNIELWNRVRRENETKLSLDEKKKQTEYN